MHLIKSLLFALLIACSIPLTDDAKAEKRVALVIGNSNYSNVRTLANPANDAAAVAVLLRSAGFDVVDARNDLNAVEMRRAVRDFSDKAHGADVALVFYAGHGIEVDGNNYLLPIDAALERDSDVEDETISLDRLLKILEPAKRLRLVIIDACRDNPFVRTMRRTSATRSIGRGLARIEPPSSDTLVAFAAKAGSIAHDGTGMHSPFTAALLQNIATPGLDLRIAFGRVRDDVLKSTANQQEPFVYGSLGGTTVSLVPPVSDARPLVAVPAPLSSATPTPAADANVTARRDYEYAAQVGTKETWDSFLAVHGTGLYADLGRAQRTKIIADQAKSPVVTTSSPATPPTVVALAPSAYPPETAVPTPDSPETARLVQAELKRLGCYSGALGSEWNTSSRRAMELFNRHSGQQLEMRSASLDALGVLRGKTTRVCPLECERGFRAEGESCVRIACRRGYAVGNSGVCEKNQQVRTTARPEPVRAQPQARPPKEPTGTSAVGSVVCGVTGCHAVPKGCRGEVRASGRDVVGVVTCGR